MPVAGLYLNKILQVGPLESSFHGWRLLIFRSLLLAPGGSVVPCPLCPKETLPLLPSLFHYCVHLIEVLICDYLVCCMLDPALPELSAG